MLTCWVKLPSRDVLVQLPLGMFDKDLDLLFRTEEAIDSAIEQLQKYKDELHKKEAES